jgi:putative transposase
MLGNGHVRFGGRVGETHQPKGWRGAPTRPLHRAPHPRGQALLRGRPRCLQPPGGWLVDRCHPTAALVTNALGMAIDRRIPPTGVIVHSDQGGQFASWVFTQRARDSGLVPSMGSVGDCYDNAVIEAFWSGLQVELLDRQRWHTRVELANAIFEYLEVFHNRQRRHSSLGMLTPIEFENIFTVA